MDLAWSSLTVGPWPGVPSEASLAKPPPSPCCQIQRLALPRAWLPAVSGGDLVSLLSFLALRSQLLLPFMALWLGERKLAEVSVGMEVLQMSLPRWPCLGWWGTAGKGSWTEVTC